MVSQAPGPVDFASFTVPQGRSDDGCFEPRAELRTGPETELYFALVPCHPESPEPGTTAEQIVAVLGNPAAGTRDGASAPNARWGRVEKS